MFLSTPDYLWNNSETQKNLHFWKIFCDMVCDGGVGCDRAPVTSLTCPVETLTIIRGPFFHLELRFFFVSEV